MDFIDLAPEPKASAIKADVRLGIQKLRKTASARGVLFIQGHVLDQLGGNRRYRIRLGQAAAKERLQLVVADDGNFEATKVGTRGDMWRIRLPQIADWPDFAVKAEEIRFEIKLTAKPKHVEVLLPAWIWNERSRLERRRMLLGAGAA